MKCYAIENHPNDSRVTVDSNGIVQTLSSRMGTGGNNTPFVLVNSSGDGISAPLDASYYKGQGLRQGIEREYLMIESYCCGNGQLVQAKIMDKVNCLDCMHDQKMILINHKGKVENPLASEDKKYVLRRLTPVECARLQGFPDWWCDGADGSDSAQYKLWGNGIALPCACDVLGRITEELKTSEG